jgi:hypothetical protein
MKGRGKVLWLVFISAIVSGRQAEALEYQPYTLIERRGDLEIRHYPSVYMAQIRVSRSSYRANLNEGFRALAAYIFGKNESSKKIGMTSPVIYTPIPRDKEASTKLTYEGRIAFVMPQGLSMLPKPKDPEVMITRTEPMTMAHREFGGFLQYAGLRTFERREAELLEWLKGEGLKTKGPVVHLYYTDPFNPIQRYAVAVEIDPKGVGTATSGRGR